MVGSSDAIESCDRGFIPNSKGPYYDGAKIAQ